MRQGDAYLLKSGRGSYLVDGGDLSGFLPEMLRERRVGKLRAAVCTSACPERLGGLLDLMDSGYPVGEYWLPGPLAALIDSGRRFCGDWPGWFRVCGWPAPKHPLPRLRASARSSADRSLARTAGLVWLCLAAATGDLPSLDRECAPAEALGTALDLLCDRAARGWPRLLSPLVQTALARLQGGGGQADLGLLCGRLLLHEAEGLPVKSDTGCREVARTLALAVMAESLRERDGLRWRLFDLSGKLEDRLVPRHPFRCLNGLEVGGRRRRSGPLGAMEVFEVAAALSGPDRGLVFRYGDAQCGVLFCGNTRLSFLDRDARLSLRRPTVVAAPQRGEVEAEEAYGRIASRTPGNHVWVRGHLSFARKVSDGFRERPVRYCLHDCAQRTVQEILLAFSCGRWRLLAGAPCRC